MEGIFVSNKIVLIFQVCKGKTAAAPAGLGDYGGRAHASKKNVFSELIFDRAFLVVCSTYLCQFSMLVSFMYVVFCTP